MPSPLKHEIERIYLDRGRKRYGLEDVNQLEHALQAAAAAERAGEGPEMIIAALTHDVGHMVHALGENPAADGVDDWHENVGADWLAARLPAAVSEPVRLHVEAKRYLCAAEPGYLDQLAPDSVTSLKLQGGPMPEAEHARFLARPYAADAVRLRRYDEMAKEAGASVPELAHVLGHLDRIAPQRDIAGLATAFRAAGFVRIESFFSAADCAYLQSASLAFAQEAAAILRAAADGAKPGLQSLIVVPEADDPAAICRFEYLLGHDPGFAQFVRARIAPVISALAGEPCLPFKDKENEKHPGGGAFRPHQDFAAYQSFGPRYNLTAMVALDPQTPENGCLEFASNLMEVAERAPGTEWFDGKPLLAFHHGGPHNGDILDDQVRSLSWAKLPVLPADLVVFDSFVPHRSGTNLTDASRRAMFLTYARARDGDWYAQYYADKRANAHDPKFHVSTPTRHAGD